MSEKYYNQPKYGVGPSSWEMLSNAPSPTSEKDERGFYNIKNGEVDRQNVATLNDYQNFVNKDWKRQHGTYESAKRFCDGLDGEYKELVWEYVKNYVPRELDFDMFSKASFVGISQFVNSSFEAFDREFSEDEKREIISESGDVMFYSVATMSNSSADLDIGMKSVLGRHLDGVRIFSEEQTTSPLYRGAQLDIAHSTLPISIQQIDELIDKGFEPLLLFANQSMNIDPDDGPEFGLASHFQFLLEKTNVLQKLAHYQYQHWPEGEPMEPEHIKPYDSFIGDISEISADILLELGYVIKHTTGHSLQDIVEKNIEKITGRVIANRIDKSDGERTPDLL